MKYTVGANCGSPENTAKHNITDNPSNCGSPKTTASCSTTRLMANEHQDDLKNKEMQYIFGLTDFKITFRCEKA